MREGVRKLVTGFFFYFMGGIKMTKVLKLKLQGDIRVEIGDPSYYDENGVPQYPDITHNKTYKNVIGEVQVHLDKSGEYPMAHILLTKKDLPNGREFSFKQSDDLASIGMAYKGLKLTQKSKELGCDTALYEVNGIPIHTGADGAYGDVTEIRVDKLLAGIIINLDGPYGMDVTEEDFYQNFYAAFQEWIVAESEESDGEK